MEHREIENQIFDMAVVIEKADTALTCLCDEWFVDVGMLLNSCHVCEAGKSYLDKMQSMANIAADYVSKAKHIVSKMQKDMELSEEQTKQTKE